MFKIDTSNAATVIPTPQSVGPKPDGFFTHGDSTGDEASDIPTQVHRDWLNAVQEEICNVITTESIDLDKNDTTQLFEAINAMAAGTGPGAGVLLSVEDDPNPTLGGDLEVNAKKIKSASGNVLIEASSGNIDFSTSPILINTTIAHRGDTDNNIVFGTDTQTFKANNSTIIDTSASGFRLGGANARVTSISNDDTMASDSATLLPTQNATKGYFAGTPILATPEEYYIFVRGFISSVSGFEYVTSVLPFALSAGVYEVDTIPVFWVETPSTLGAPNFRYNFLSAYAADDGSLANLCNAGNAQSNEGMYTSISGGHAWIPFVGTNGTTPLVLVVQMSSQSPTPPRNWVARFHFRRTA